MSTVNGNYGTYDNLRVSTANKTEKTESKTVKLSENAQKYLEQLKSKYKNMDFIVADFSSDEEAQKYLEQGNGEYNCVITPETLEKMAADEDEKAKYEGIIDNALNDLSGIKEKLGDDADKVKNYGVSIDSEGKVSYYAIIKESLKENENVKAAREKAVENKAEAEKKAEKEEFKERLVKASTVEDLIELIKGGKSEKDRIEFGKDNDDALKIDRVDFGSNKTPAYEEYVPSAAPDVKTPFDFKA